MTVATYVDSDQEIRRALPWAARIAAARGEHLALLVARPGGAGGKAGIRRVDLLAATLEDGAAGKLGVTVRGILTKILGEDGWLPLPEDPDEAAQLTETPGGALAVSLHCLAAADPVAELETWLAVQDPRAVIAVQEQLDAGDSEAGQRRRRILRMVSCEIILVRPGIGDDAHDGTLLATVGYGPHCVAALRLARDLGATQKRAVTALHVARDLGPDTVPVGQRLVRRRLLEACGERACDFSEEVVVDRDPHAAIARVCAEGGHDVVLLGTSQVGGTGRSQRRSVGMRLQHIATEPTVVLVRARVRIAERTRRRFAGWVQQLVPQLEREQRLALVERIRKSSGWDFDFVSLMVLATAIAAMGLLADSVAVVIGAMLVAPLMTPLLGVGMGLVQGNPVFALQALRSIGFGFLTALGIGVLVGVLSPGSVVPTAEMAVRDWPDLRDLWIAFVSGLAAAYASSRPGLLAALPGVAIAAALVPPIATGGLALAMGELWLAAGAVLLFLVNMAAIVLASALTLWTVGLRYERGGHAVTRILGYSLVLVLLVSGVLLAWGPEYRPHAVPAAFETAVRTSVAAQPGLGVRDLRWARDAQGRVLVVDLSGALPPSAAVVTAVRELAQTDFGVDVAVRIGYVWRTPPP